MTQKGSKVNQYIIKESNNLLIHVAKVIKSESEILNLSNIYFDLYNYKNHFNLTDVEINLIKEKKSKNRGKFEKGVIQTDEHNNSKLVRDNYFGLTTFGKHTYSYKFAAAMELPILLKQKLIEECVELSKVSEHLQSKTLPQDITKQSRLEELADVYEVLDALVKCSKIDRMQIEIKVNDLIASSETKY